MNNYQDNNIIIKLKTQQVNHAQHKVFNNMILVYHIVNG